MLNILIITPFYFPGFRSGGPVVSTSNIMALMEGNYHFKILTHNFDMDTIAAPYQKILPNQWIKAGGHYRYYTRKMSVSLLTQIISEVRPDIVYLNSFFAKTTRNTLLAIIMARYKKKIIIAPRGEFDSGAFQLKTLQKKVYTYLWRTVVPLAFKQLSYHATSEDEATNIFNVIKAKKITVAHNIPRGPAEDETALIYSKLHFKKFIFFSRISQKKGLYFLLKILDKYSLPPTTLDIYGLIEDSIYWEKCQMLIKKLNKSKNHQVVYRGLIQPENIRRTLHNYDFNILPTLSENFGHSIFEGMAFGTIPIISTNTPWKNLIDKKLGFDLALDPDIFFDCLSAVHKFTDEKLKEYQINNIKFAANYIQSHNFLEEYKKLFSYSFNRRKRGLFHLLD